MATAAHGSAQAAHPWLQRRMMAAGSRPPATGPAGSAPDEVVWGRGRGPAA
jgi:hypothetical protein